MTELVTTEEGLACRSAFETMLAAKFPSVKQEIIAAFPIPDLSFKGCKAKSLEQYVESLTLLQVFQVMHLHPLRDRDKVLKSGAQLHSKLLEKVLGNGAENTPMSNYIDPVEPVEIEESYFTPEPPRRRVATGSSTVATEAHLISWIVTFPYYASSFRELLLDVESEDFSSIKYGVMYKAIMQAMCSPELQDTDNDTFCTLFDSQLEKNLRNVGMSHYNAEISRLKQKAVPLEKAQVSELVFGIKRRTALDALQQVGQELSDMAKRPGTQSIKDICEAFTTRLQNLSGAEWGSQKDGPQHAESIVSLITGRLAEIDDRKKNGYQPPLFTGYPMLDDMITGLTPTCLYILAARPSVGKTAFALNVMENIALSDQTRGKPILFFSLEMAGAQIADRVISTFTKTPCSAISQGRMESLGDLVTNTKKLDILDAQGNSVGSSIYVCDVGSMNTKQMREEATLLVNKFGGVSLIVVDYLQLMHSADNTYKASRNLEISEITRDFKFMSKDYNCPVLLLSQLNRSVETRSDATPQLSDLRDSGAIEQDADVIMFLSRQNPQQLSDPMRWLDVAKNRQGQTGRVPLEYQGDHSQFRPCA